MFNSLTTRTTLPSAVQESFTFCLYGFSSCATGGKIACSRCLVWMCIRQQMGKRRAALDNNVSLRHTAVFFQSSFFLAGPCATRQLTDRPTDRPMNRPTDRPTNQPMKDVELCEKFTHLFMIFTCLFVIRHEITRQLLSWLFLNREARRRMFSVCTDQVRAFR